MGVSIEGKTIKVRSAKKARRDAVRCGAERRGAVRCGAERYKFIRTLYVVSGIIIMLSRTSDSTTLQHTH